MKVKAGDKLLIADPRVGELYRTPTRTQFCITVILQNPFNQKVKTKQKRNNQKLKHLRWNTAYPARLRRKNLQRIEKLRGGGPFFLGIKWKILIKTTKIKKKGFEWWAWNLNWWVKTFGWRKKKRREREWQVRLSRHLKQRGCFLWTLIIYLLWSILQSEIPPLSSLQMEPIQSSKTSTPSPSTSQTHT